MVWAMPWNSITALGGAAPPAAAAAEEDPARDGADAAGAAGAADEVLAATSGAVITAVFSGKTGKKAVLPTMIRDDLLSR
jgi:hypothetical protein